MKVLGQSVADPEASTTSAVVGATLPTEPMTYEGLGDSVIRLDPAIPPHHRVFKVSHFGHGDFVLVGVDGSGIELEMIARGSGNFEVSVLADEPSSFLALTVEAVGQWAITAYPISEAREFGPGQAWSGSGSEVLFIADPLGDEIPVLRSRRLEPGSFRVDLFDAEGMPLDGGILERDSGTELTIIDPTTRALAVVTEEAWTLSLGEALPPEPVIGVATTSVDDKLVVTWIAPPDGGAPIEGYQVYWQPSMPLQGGTNTQYVHVGADTTRAELADLELGQSYEVSVRAINVEGTGPDSAWVNGIVPVPPEAPTNLGAEGSISSIDLSWSVPHFHGGSTVDRYVIEYSSDSGETWTTASDTSVNELIGFCLGDSGGPFTVEIDGEHHLAGVVSYGATTQCADAGMPNVATRVPAYADWIEATLDQSAQTQIVGGNKTTIEERPFQVALILAGGDPYEAQFCGGTLIAAKWVVTAAHCTAGLPDSDYEIGVGHTRLTDIQSSDRIGVASTHIHPSYNPEWFTHDIALVELKTSVGAWIPWLREDGSITAGTIGTTSGWGSTDTASPVFPDELHSATVSVLETGPGGSCGEDRSFSPETGICLGGRATATIDGLHSDLDYLIRVAAANVAGIGSFSEITTASTFSILPDAPTHLAASSEVAIDGIQVGRWVDLTWTEPLFDGGQPITGYIIEYASSSSDGTPNDAWMTLSLEEPETEARLSGLLYTHVFRVRAVNRNGTSNPSSLITFYGATTPAAPTRVEAYHCVGSRYRCSADWTIEEPLVVDGDSFEPTSWCTSCISRYWTDDNNKHNQLYIQYSWDAGGLPRTHLRILVSKDGGPWVPYAGWGDLSADGGLRIYDSASEYHRVYHWQSENPTIELGSTYTYRISVSNAIGYGPEVERVIFIPEVPMLGS